MDARHKTGCRALFCCLAAVLLPAANAFGATTTTFSGDRAFENLLAQCRFGPRPPGTAAHRKCLDWIGQRCRAFDLETTHQSFRAHLRLTRKTVRLTNVIAVHQPQNPRKIMLSTHWDTRPYADRERDPSKRRIPILGANDGASGVAVLIELARLFQTNPPPVGVVFAFFDGEDAGVEQGGGWCLGSQHLADNLRPGWDFELGINLDMIGDRDLQLPIEAYTWEKARRSALSVWEIGRQLSPGVFQTTKGRAVFDDHMPFLEKGKRYINIVDIDYRYWHTLEDTEDKCSRESLESVGRVVARFVQSRK